MGVDKSEGAVCAQCACAVASLCALTVVRSCDSQPEAFEKAGESRLSRDGNIPCMASELNHREGWRSTGPPQ